MKRDEEPESEAALAAPATGLEAGAAIREPSSNSRSGRLLLAAGPRVAENRLLEEVVTVASEREARLRAGDLSALRTPLRVVVPSQSLRGHIAARLVAHAGRSLLGVEVQTHVALALEALDRAGLAAPAGSALVPVLVRRHAAGEPVLADWLGDLDDGYGIVEAAVRDLLDAGFDATSAEAFVDAIAAVRAEGEISARVVDRAQATGRVALHTLAALENDDLGHRTALLARARAALHAPGASPEMLLPTAGLWIHGFADATGLVLEWLEALVRAFAARIVVDVPEDPAAPGRRETRYAKEFCDRLRDAARGSLDIEGPAGAGSPAAIELLRAPGAAAELRAVAARIRARLDAGAAPESIGIVASNLEPYRAVLAAQLDRLGIPFSVEGASAGPDAATRRVVALERLLAAGAAAPVDTWLAADARPAAADPDLRVALHVLGAGRLGQLARLDLEAVLGAASSLPIPVRRGGVVGARRAGDDDAVGDASQPAAATRNRRRHIARDRLEQARAGAVGVLAALHRWPATAPFAVHLAALRALLQESLGWSAESATCAPALATVDALESEIPSGFELAREEMAQLVTAALEDACQAPLGGAGGGVAVLTFTAARARTFSELFVLGMNRGGFPRVVPDDPVLPDALRLRIRRDLLSEMPVKDRLRDEERAVFASLCAAAPRVVLAWQHVSDEGRTRVESPFLTRLRVARTDRELPEFAAPPVLGLEPIPAREIVASPRPAHEHAVLAGLAGAADDAEGAADDAEGAADDPERSASGARPQSPGLRGLALAEVRRTLREDARIGDPCLADLDLEALTRHQEIVSHGLDLAPPGAREIAAGVVPSLGPWFGFVGPASPPAEMPSGSVTGPQSEFFVTRLEQIARCPWQAFLRRELGLESVPDALDVLPAPTSLLLGRLVDAVLGRVVNDALPAPRHELMQALAAGPVHAPWPRGDVLERWIADAAREVARAAGIALPGFAAALARCVRPLLDAARAADWSDPAGPAVLGAELRAVVVVPDAQGRSRGIGFRADRVDLSSEGGLRITDYKAGTPLSSAEAEATRQRHLLAAIRRGEKLQAVVYHVGGRALAPDRPAEGRYLFLAEDVAEKARSLAVAGDAYGASAVDGFHEVARKLFEAVDRGAFVPRLDTPERQAPCSTCDVAAACLRGESAHRGRLVAWMDAAITSDPAALTPTERAALGVLRLATDARDAAREERGASDPETT